MVLLDPLLPVLPAAEAVEGEPMEKEEISPSNQEGSKAAAITSPAQQPQHALERHLQARFLQHLALDGSCKVLARLNETCGNLP